MRTSVKRKRRDSRNIAIALALLALAVVLFLVTIVKFGDQMQRSDMSQTQEETKPPQVPTLGIAPLPDDLLWPPEEKRADSLMRSLPGHELPG